MPAHHVMAARLKRLNGKPRGDWTFGEKMLYYRLGLGIDQKAAAIRAGLHQGYWCLLEKGRYPDPHLSTIKKVAKALGVYTSSLVD
jgi:predicted transcriptional regulator